MTWLLGAANFLPRSLHLLHIHFISNTTDNRVICYWWRWQKYAINSLLLSLYLGVSKNLYVDHVLLTKNCFESYLNDLRKGSQRSEWRWSIRMPICIIMQEVIISKIKRGVQQRDPLGPLASCIGIMKLTHSTSFKLNCWMMAVWAITLNH